MGTDQVKAFDKALLWLDSPEQASADRKILIMWSDMRPDTWKKNGKTVSDPALMETLPWDPARGLKLDAFFLGVSNERQSHTALCLGSLAALNMQRTHSEMLEEGVKRGNNEYRKLRAMLFARYLLAAMIVYLRCMTLPPL
jgi:hypothetical protein